MRNSYVRRLVDLFGKVIAHVQESIWGGSPVYIFLFVATFCVEGFLLPYVLSNNIQLLVLLGLPSMVVIVIALLVWKNLTSRYEDEKFKRDLGEMWRRETRRSR